MALSKYEKLGRAIRQTLDQYDRFYEDVNNLLKAFQIQICGACDDRSLAIESTALTSLEDAKREAILYCASQDELFEWVDWFDRENKAFTLTNNLWSIADYYENETALHTNLLKSALPYFEETAYEFFGKFEYEKMQKSLNESTDFVPTQDTSLAQAYDLVIVSLMKREKRYHDDLKRDWRSSLEEGIMESVNWQEEQKNSFFKEWHSLLRVKHGLEEKGFAVDGLENSTIVHHVPRSKTSFALDHQTYASFILYFANQFCANPSNKRLGEIALFLWLTIQTATNPELVWTLEQLLGLTTANLNGRILTSEDGKEIVLSSGLANLFHDFTGGKCIEKEQSAPKENTRTTRRIKLFPNLTIDNLEDALHDASLALLPGKPAALPAAFLTFPHPLKGLRMHPKARKRQQLHPGKIYHDPIPWRKLKQKLEQLLGNKIKKS